jgi:ABC-type nitrate/sulfonate/bicarbonate transport system substrate-binding protein
MTKTPIRLSLLRGVCQLPAYAAHACGMFADEGLESSVSVTATAWLIPEQLLSGACEFAVLPWTRVAAAETGEAPLKVLCGSGHEEAAIVVRKGMDISDVRTVAVPREGGIKDLTAMGLIESLGWGDCKQLRFPSGDGAIISFFGEGADAASMVEPYASMLEELGTGTVVRRTGDIWPGAPGCSLSAAASYIDVNPDVVQRVVNAYVRAVDFVLQNMDEAAKVAEPFIGIHAKMIRAALANNQPRADAIRNTGSMNKILSLMQRLGYVERIPTGFADLSFLDRAQGPGADSA